MNCPVWLDNAANADAIPRQIPALILENGPVNDLNVSVRGSVKNGLFAESRTAEEIAYYPGGRPDAAPVTWGQVAIREQQNINLIADWVSRNLPDLHFKFSGNVSAFTRPRMP